MLGIFGNKAGRTEASFSRAYLEETGYLKKKKGDPKEAKRASFLTRRLQKGSRVLNIGCGTADLSALFAEKGFISTAVDVAREVVAVAREKHGEKIALLQADARNLPIGNDSTDAVVAADFVEHVPLKDSAVVRSEVFRVLRPGGFFLLESPVKSPLTILDFAFKRTFLRGGYRKGIDHTGDLTHHFWWTKSQWQSYVGEAFEVKEVDYLIFRGLHWPRPTLWRKILDRLDSKNYLTRFLAVSVIIVAQKPEESLSVLLAD